MKRVKISLCLVFCLVVVNFVYAKEAKNKKEKEVVVEINKTKITLWEFNKRWNEIPEQSRYGITKEKLLDGMIQEELITQESLKNGIDKTESYKKSLADVKKQLLVREYLNKEIIDKVKVSDKDMENYYEINKAEYVEQEKIKARHILVKTEDEAKEILKALNLNKGDFEKLAKEKSIDTVSGKNGGDLGAFGHGEMVPEFEKIAFALKEGEISEPVKTEFGFHIILAGGKIPSKQKELKEVKEQIEKTLLRLKQRDKFEKLMEEFKKKSEIIEHRELLKD